MFRLYCCLIFACCNLAFAASQAEILSPDVQAGLRSDILNPIEPHLVFNSDEAANAWLSDMSNRLKKWVPDESLRKHYLTIIQYESARAGLDPQMVLSLITVESKFNKFALSNKGARGMMQIMPFWQAQIGTNTQNLFDIQTNIRYGCTILRYYLDRQNLDMNRALAAYNGSLGQLWYPNLVMNAYYTYWQPASVIEIKNGKVVTVDYIDK
jgi:soluble lytic murein transglycosylase-like protein